MPCNLVLKKNLLKSVLAGPMNSARDLHKNAKCKEFQYNPKSKLNLRLFDMVG